MKRDLGILITIGSVLLALLLLTGLVWANSRYARAHAGEKDFLVPWLAARTFIQYGDSPYSEPAAQRAQIVYYGHVAAADEDPLYLWLPLPVELLYFPFALISNYSWALGLWMTLCEVALIALAYLALQLTGWRPGRILFAALMLFSVFWIFGWWSLASGGASALVGLALVGALVALRAEQDELTGALLLLPVFSPRSSGVFLILMLWWIIRHKRWRILAGFGMLLFVLVGLAFFLLPGWLVPSIHSMLTHSLYNPGYSSIGLLTAWSPTLGSRLSWLLAGGLLLLLLGEWGLAQDKDQRRFLWAVGLTLTVTPLIGVPVFPADYVFLLLPLVQMLAILTERWPNQRTMGLAGIVLACVFAVFWLLPLALGSAGASSALAGTLVLLMPFLLLIGLYWDSLVDRPAARNPGNARMNRRLYMLLAVLGLAVAGTVAAFQAVPGYMDADYYYAGGLQLAGGHGFTEPYLWNYLDDPTGLPHPAFSYWMPLASLLAAAGVALFGPGSWSAARIGFLAAAAAIPPVTAALAWSLSSRRDLSLTAGLLAVLSCFYLPFLPTTDTFGLYMLLGGLFFLTLGRKPARPAALLGLLAGLMHLSRADGLLWLLMAFIAVLLLHDRSKPKATILYSLLSVLAGYLIVMGPWFARNAAVFGSPLAPGASRTLWLTRYEQLFAFPADRLTFHSWWQSGIAAILRVRLWALGLNLASLLSVQWEIFLLPLVLLGLWHLRRDGRIQVAALAGLFLLGAMTILFPLAGARGGYFHSGAALQPIWWALAPIGLDRFISWAARKRRWNAAQALPVFRAALVCLAALLSGVIVYTRVLGGGGGQAWGQENAAYQRIHAFLVSRGAGDNSLVMVVNPPGYYLASGNPAIAVPDADLELVLAAALRYGAGYLILEKAGMPPGVLAVYDNPGEQGCLGYLGEVEEARVFSFEACIANQP